MYYSAIDFIIAKRIDVLRIYAKLDYNYSDLVLWPMKKAIRTFSLGTYRFLLPDMRLGPLIKAAVLLSR